MKENKSVGLGIPSVLLIVFIVLKCCNIIDWSWLWVLSPLWIVVLLKITILVLVTIGMEIHNYYK